MKSVNILNLSKACINFQDKDIENAKTYYNFSTRNKQKYSKVEMEGIYDLFYKLEKIDENPELYENFYCNLTIPKISKEFDLLKFGEDKLINIELKTRKNESEILKQLRQNYYYLKFLGKDLALFTYKSDEKILYYYNEQDDSLNEVDVVNLMNELKKINDITIDDVYSLFNPNKYLVSPFNQTEKFLNNEYFLNDEQNEKRKIIIKKLRENEKFIGITGKAGSGKTLMIYDLYMKLRDNNSVYIIHGGNLNEGHKKLRKEDFSIYPAKEIYKVLENKPEIILIDEGQRIYENQFNSIIRYINESNAKLVVSYDILQTLADNEADTRTIKFLCGLKNNFNLRGKVRSNKEVIQFIKGLFNKNKVIVEKYDNVDINYFTDKMNAVNYIKYLISKGSVYLEYSTSSYYPTDLDDYSINKNKTSHRIIGQEFDDVVVLIDEKFYYNENKLLRSKKVENCNYNLMMMLYQNATRARDKLHLVIINNLEVFEHVSKFFEYTN